VKISNFFLLIGFIGGCNFATTSSLYGGSVFLAAVSLVFSFGSVYLRRLEKKHPERNWEV